VSAAPYAYAPLWITTADVADKPRGGVRHARLGEIGLRYLGLTILAQGTK
jgi:hypothetical protein